MDEPQPDVTDAPIPGAPKAAESPDVESPPELPSGPLPVTFTGSGHEYFRIWIVNIALTVLTLGLYSAWAKVRRLQYFHRHTHLAGASFDYHGDPIVIFKGRLVGGALFLLYSFAGYVSPLFALAVAMGVACIMPWMLARSLRFRLHNTSYRGLRFRFSGSTKSAYWVLLGLPLLTVVSLFTLGPFWHQRLKRYQYGNASFGDAPFASTPPAQDFYAVYIFAGMIGAVVVGAFGALIAGITFGLEQANNSGTPGAGEPGAWATVVLATAFAVYLGGILLVQSFLTARLRNVVWNHTSIRGYRFVSALRTRWMLWLTVSNLVATIASLGLFWPYSQIRLTRYFTEALSVADAATFENFAAVPAAEEGAVGQEVASFFDFDIAF